MHCEIQFVSKYYHEIDKNNNYFSVSSDCCVLCGLTLKCLDLEFYGTKNNLCSSRFWKPPVFFNEKTEFKKNFVEISYNQLKKVDDLLLHRKYKAYNSPHQQQDENCIPYSDECIENQYLIFDKLSRKFSNKKEIYIFEIINSKIRIYYNEF